MGRMTWDAIVLAGGTSRRLGGVDKAGVDVGGRLLLDRALAAVSAAEHVIVAGPPRETRAPVTWCREDPPGGGPVAALAAALPLVQSDMVLVLAVDHPFLRGSTVVDLVDAAAGHDGAVLLDATGRDQPLAAAYAAAVLRRRLAEQGPPAGTAVRRLVAGLDLVRLPGGDAALDCDTWDDVARARARVGEERHER